MSRVGKYPVKIPAGVTVAVAGRAVTAKGKLGELRLDLVDDVDVAVADGLATVTPRSQHKRARAMWGTTRANIGNMVKGVSEGFQKKLEITGTGYRAAIEGKELVLSLGYSHPIKYPIPVGVQIVCEKPTTVVVSGADAQRVGQIAAEIRGYRGPEPYKGKGVRYADEVIVRKEGKKK